VAAVAERPRFEVANIVRKHGEEYLRTHPASAAQKKALRNIAACRTAALGGHVDECDQCDVERISYNSCRDRHCPKCQGERRAKWITDRLEALLPVPYFHVVFTLPDELNPLMLRNPRATYGMLFDTAADTLKQLARDPKHLGAQIGFTAVLHTWGQNLLFHPHLHCVVTGGGLALDGTAWVVGREDYLLPVKVLGSLFRGKFLDALQRARKRRELEFAGSTADLADDSVWAAFKESLYRKSWVVYAKPPFGGPEQVFRYLGRYTHSVAISNHRLVDLADGDVTFTMKDYADHGAEKTMTVSGVEFLRRFLLHVLPKGFTRIRHYGLCATGKAKVKLEKARLILTGVTSPSRETGRDRSWQERFFERTGIDTGACPECKKGRLRRVRDLPRGKPSRVQCAIARSPP
jgi:Putative transposase/Transposase zinc-binding domain